MSGWLADRARLIMSASGTDPLVVKEAARKALPEATSEVNAVWEATLAEPGRQDLREQFHQLAQHHSALKELAE